MPRIYLGATKCEGGAHPYHTLSTHEVGQSPFVRRPSPQDACRVLRSLPLSAQENLARTHLSARLDHQISNIST